MSETKTALDVWLKFTEAGPLDGGRDEEGDDLATYEANTFRTRDGFTVEWYHNAVGQVSRRTFATYAEARAWLEAEGFEDFSS